MLLTSLVTYLINSATTVTSVEVYVWHYNLILKSNLFLLAYDPLKSLEMYLGWMLKSFFFILKTALKGTVSGLV